ncbi:MAG TPA: DUF2254 family protein [Kribbella sp.]
MTVCAILPTAGLHDGRYTDQEGQLRLIVRTLQWDGYVRLAFDEIREAGAGLRKSTVGSVRRS